MEKRRIVILWPTVRPEELVKTLQEWIDKTSKLSKFYEDILVHAIVRDEEQALYIQERTKIKSILTGNNGLCSALYHLTSNLELRDEDIVLVVFDDMFPPQEWDMVLYKEFCCFDGGIIFNDGIQYEAGISTMPCLTFGTLKKINRVIYHPEYLHLFGDNEYFDNLLDLGLLLDVRKVNPIIFEHRHHSTGKRPADSVDAWVDSCFKVDQETYNRRKLLPVEKRILV